jgi:hypothetical protein
MKPLLHLKTFWYQLPSDAASLNRKHGNGKRLVYYERGAELGDI